MGVRTETPYHKQVCPSWSKGWHLRCHRLRSAWVRIPQLAKPLGISISQPPRGLFWKLYTL